MPAIDIPKGDLEIIVITLSILLVLCIIACVVKPAYDCVRCVVCCHGW